MRAGIMFWLIGLVMIGVWGGVALFSRGARMRRRRRKSHTRLTSKVNRPMVRFSVRTPKK
jgi:hypothetical protein